uniref:Protein kinase domain-containing protein n=1 Tax=Hyaloperonospora arabidopsidis (strain Emoy2) TaxID=559515 RepID=M4B9A8_HYAAE
MTDSRRLALERWREDRRRQKEGQVQATVKVAGSMRRVVTHRLARESPVRTRITPKQRERPSPVTSSIDRQVSQVSVPLEPIEEQEKLLYKTPAKARSDTGAETDIATSAASADSVESGSFFGVKKRRRRRSYISPSSNAPSLAGGAQRVLTPTRQLLEQESDDDEDGGMDEDMEGQTLEVVPGPRRVSVLAQQRMSGDGAEPATPYKMVQDEEDGQSTSRETVSLGSISMALHTTDACFGKEDNIKREAGPTLQQFSSHPALQIKRELQQPLPVRMKTADDDESASIKVESSTPEQKLFFFDRAPLNSAQISTRTSIDPKACCQSLSGRASLDESKPVRSLSERMEGNPKWEMDDFFVTRNLGQGKFGNVYLAKEKCSDISVALKSPLTRDGGANNLKREIEIQVRLCHPNILRMHGYFYDDSCVYMVLEYAPYGELFKELAKEKYFADAVAAHYVAQVVEALKYCHSCNVIHRDIKGIIEPSSLLILGGQCTRRHRIIFGRHSAELQIT